MKKGRIPHLLAPARWPVRWRIAIFSAGLTFAILLIFAGIVGQLTEQRLRNDFRNEVQSTASELAFSIQIDRLSLEPLIDPEALERALIGNDVIVQVVDISGNPVGNVTEPEPRIPPPSVSGDDVVSIGNLTIATRPLLSAAGSTPPVFVQYARDHDELDATIGRLWLFLGIGIAGGTILAALAGLVVARRAMVPITALTGAAREIASTRDPSRSMPTPQADDEVAELARTLDEMLHELDVARSEAQQMVLAQREFVADASHELRTPLTSILANLELLHDRLETNGDAASEEAEMIGSALRSSRRMRRLVADLLLLARADAGRSGERHPCDLADIVRGAADEVRPLSSAHELILNLQQPIPVHCNRDELHRLVLNLLENGARHTPPGSTIEVSLVRRDGKAVLDVADDGPGLPEGAEDHIFKRFVRGDSARADVASDAGTGLGLAIVRAVANSHGGSLEAGASPSGGARFTVALPLTGEGLRPLQPALVSNT